MTNITIEYLEHIKFNRALQINKFRGPAHHFHWNKTIEGMAYWNAADDVYLHSGALPPAAQALVDEMIRVWDSKHLPQPNPIRLQLVDKPNWRPLTHGGKQDWRVKELHLNGVVMETFREGSGDTNYATESRYDEIVNRVVTKFTTALGVQCEGHTLNPVVAVQEECAHAPES